MNNWQIVVVLLPALFCAVLAFFLTFPAWLANRLQSREFVEMLRDILINLAGAGTTLGAFIGFKEGTTESIVIAAVFAGCMLGIINALTRHLEALRLRDERRAEDARLAELERSRQAWRD